MANLQINFDNGEGTLNLDYTGTPGTSTVTPEADCNCGEDRATNISVSVEGGEVSKNVTINQTGVREQFIPADEEEGMMGADGDYFLGIKDNIEVQDMPLECQPYAKIVLTASNIQDTEAIQQMLTAAGGADARIRVKIGNDVEATDIQALFDGNTGALKDCTNMWLDFREFDKEYPQYFLWNNDGIKGLIVPKYPIIPVGAFADLGIDKIYIPDTVTEVGSAALQGNNMTSIVLPESVTKIGDSAFYNCSKLESVNIPSGVKEITNVFSNCAKLKQVKFSEGLTTIGFSCFSGCTKLNNLVIPSTVTSITNTAFQQCLELTDLKYLGGSDPTIGNGVFEDAHITKICVTEAYQGETFGGLPVEVC